MSELIWGMLPILVIWAFPLAPMLYAAIAASIEAVTTPVRREGREPATAAELAT
jgi:hypothetical protein